MDFLASEALRLPSNHSQLRRVANRVVTTLGYKAVVSPESKPKRWRRSPPVSRAPEVQGGVVVARACLGEKDEPARPLSVQEIAEGRLHATSPIMVVEDVLTNNGIRALRIAMAVLPSFSRPSELTLKPDEVHILGERQAMWAHINPDRFYRSQLEAMDDEDGRRLLSLLNGAHPDNRYWRVEYEGADPSTWRVPDLGTPPTVCGNGVTAWNYSEQYTEWQRINDAPEAQQPHTLL
jgi:hypothetical protein